MIRYYFLVAPEPNTHGRLHLLLERVASLFRSDLRGAASAHGLKLVQLEALVYLSMANRYSDTALALSDYLRVTKGTVSQTLKALERRNLIEKVPDETDGRVQHCQVTPEGLVIAKEAFPAKFLGDVDQPMAHDSVAVLEHLLRSLQESNGYRTFGLCRSCRFFEPRTRGGRCGLTKEPLSVSDSRKICREHEMVQA